MQFLKLAMFPYKKVSSSGNDERLRTYCTVLLQAFESVVPARSKHMLLSKNTKQVKKLIHPNMRNRRKYEQCIHLNKLSLVNQLVEKLKECPLLRPFESLKYLICSI